MTNLKTTKRALISSVVALLVCFSMLIGTTYAWFTDSVTSAGNIIKSGTLDVEMHWAEGKLDPNADATTWTDASTGAIFNNDKWEPGYVEVRHIKISNVGTLALKYQLHIYANGDVSDLADVIDVYFVDPAVQVADRTALDGLTPVGTLTEVLAGMPGNASGDLLADETDTVTLALKMRENAGNEYQNKAIGSDFVIQLLATQLTAESDSFDDQYDSNATYPVLASTAAALRDAMKTDGANIVLTNDITVTADDTTGYGQHMFLANGKSVKIDLNGHNIIISEDASQIGSAFAVANGGKIILEGDGTVEVKNGKSFIGWTLNGSGSIEVRGGNYFGNGHEGNNALFYVQDNTGKIDVYGGKFDYPIAANDNWGFNAHDGIGNKTVIEIHEGALLRYEQFQYGDNSRIQLAEGCSLEETVIDGETWYQVVKG